MLRKSNKVRTVHGSLAIEGNTLELEQVTALLDGQRVIGLAKDEIQEVRNAIEVYERIHHFKPHSVKDLLKAHRMMMKDLLPIPRKPRFVSLTDPNR